MIGAGVIGLEMGSVWRRLGSEVTILEALPAFLPAVDEQVAKEAFRVFNGPLDLKIYTGVNMTSVKAGKKGVSVTYTDREGNTQMADFDKLIVAIGRVPNTAGLGAESSGAQARCARVRRNRRTQSHQPARMCSRSGTWCAGPCWRTSPSEEGVAVAETIAGGSKSRQSRHHPLGDLHVPGDCLGRQDGAATQGRGAAVPRRPVPVHRQRAGPSAGRDRRVS